MRFDPIREAGPVSRAEPGKASPQKTGSTAFADALRQASRQPAAPVARGRVEFSKHATERLEQRGVKLTDDLLARLDRAVDRAAAKGSQTSLVQIDGNAFVVGVPSRTVVTVATQADLKEKVFTNIDSLVIA